MKTSSLFKPAWDSITLGEIYDGIELRLRAYGNNVEKIFTVNPGRISIALIGAGRLR